MHWWEIQEINDLQLLSELLMNEEDVICAKRRIEELTGKSICQFLEEKKLVAKVLPVFKTVALKEKGRELRWLLDEFHKRKYGYYFNDNGPRLDRYELEEQVYERDLDKAYENVSYNDIDIRLCNIIDRGIDSSDEMSYISSQEDHEEFKAILREYTEWSIGKLVDMDLLLDKDRES